MTLDKLAKDYLKYMLEKLTLSFSIKLFLWVINAMKISDQGSRVTVLASSQSLKPLPNKDLTFLD